MKARLLQDAAPLSRALAQIDTRDGWIDAYFERREVTDLHVSGASRDVVRQREEGLSVRLVHTGSWLASRDDLSGEAFTEACRQVARVAPRVPLRAPERLAAPWAETFGSEMEAGGSSAREAESSHDWEQRAELLEDFPSALSAALAELRVAFGYQLRLRHLRRACQVVADVFASEVQCESFYALEVRSERLRYGTLLAELGNDVASRVARQICAQFRARDASAPTPRRCPVVLAPRATAVLLHEAVAHALEADLLALSGRPAAAMGVQLGSPLLDVLDDPHSAPIWVRRSCDDEGIPTQRRWLLRKGVVEQPLADRLWARGEEGFDPGAGWRSDRHVLPLPRTRHLELRCGAERGENGVASRGAANTESLLRAAVGGFFVDSLVAGRLDPLDGRVTLEAPFVRAITSDGVGERRGGVRLSGSLAELLSGVVGVGQEARTGGAGWCAKGGQRLPVWATAPAVLLESVRLSPVGDPHA